LKQRLADAVAGDEETELERLSKHFVLISYEDDDEPPKKAYKPDGGYFPRAVFVHNGQVVRELKNPARATGKYQYFYTGPQDLINGFKAAMAHFDLSDDSGKSTAHDEL
jgi:protein-disulfide reductase (glutathione)